MNEENQTDKVSDHWSDCAINNPPAYPAGPCNCMPTPAMCRAAVEYANGVEAYARLPPEVLAIEEQAYAEIWRAMQAKSPLVNANESLARALLDPEDLGHAATPEIRDRARQVLGIKAVETK